MLTSEAQGSLFAPSGAARSTRVLLFDHRRFPPYFLDASFETGNFRPGQKPPGEIEAESIGGYRAESQGCGAGVTNAVALHGKQSSAPFPSVCFAIFDPLSGSDSRKGQGHNGLPIRCAGSAGPASVVGCDVRDA